MNFTDNVIGSNCYCFIARLLLDLSWPHYYPNCLRVVYHFVGRSGPAKPWVLRLSSHAERRMARLVSALRVTQITGADLASWI